MWAWIRTLAGIFAVSLWSTPILELIEPRPFTVITKNTVRLLAAVSDSSVAEIRYFLRYKPAVDSFKAATLGTITRQLGSTRPPAMEFIADLTAIPDQDERTINFYVEGYDSKSRLLAVSDIDRFLVLDRHPVLSGRTFASQYRRTPPVIDGVAGPGEWAGSDSLSFLNGENEIRARSLWNSEALYFLVEVNDDSIVAAYAARGYLEKNLEPLYHPMDSDFVPLPANDEIELFFDATHDHPVRRTLGQYHFLVGAGGAWYGRNYDRKPKVSDMWGRAIKTAVMPAQGHAGYVVEMAVPWTELKLKPVKGLEIGFDLYNKDFIRANGPSSGISWNGTEWTHYNNPSEWGDLVLRQPIEWFRFIAAVCSLALIAFLLYFFRRRSGMVPQEPDANPRNVQMADRLDQIIRENYQDSDLTVQKAAEKVGLHPKYAGAVYKNVRGKSFIQQLLATRMEKALELLKNSDLNITDIAFKVGFNSSSHFAKVFRDFHQISPTDVRRGQK